MSRKRSKDKYKVRWYRAKSARISFSEMERKYGRFLVEKKMSTETLNYRIRKAILDDAWRIAEVGLLGMPGYPFEYIYDPDKIRMELEQPTHHRIVADHRDYGIIGSAVLGLDELMCEVKRVVVHPLVRRNGAAKVMTTNLVNLAVEQGLISWSDARADQIGMQKAALSAGLRPISLEPGKHVVYSHKVEDLEIGPGRETMVHLTSLMIPEEGLYKDLREWPDELKDALCGNLERSFHPQTKSGEMANSRIPSANWVKKRVDEALQNLPAVYSTVSVSEDIITLASGGSQMVVIKPDASAFILSFSGEENLSGLLETAERTGLQIATYYSNITNSAEAMELARCGMEPAMIRPWQKRDEKPQWQVGWRRTCNDYAQCLHNIHLDAEVERTIIQFQERLNENI